MIVKKNQSYFLWVGNSVSVGGRAASTEKKEKMRLKCVNKCYSGHIPRLYNLLTWLSYIYQVEYSINMLEKSKKKSKNENFQKRKWLEVREFCVKLYLTIWSVSEHFVMRYESHKKKISHFRMRKVPVNSLNWVTGKIHWCGQPNISLLGNACERPQGSTPRCSITRPLVPKPMTCARDFMSVRIFFCTFTL